jgi:thiol-disulfide isomerase/thioredoxin
MRKLAWFWRVNLFDMSIESRLALILGVVAIAVAAGWVWRARTGRAKLVTSGGIIDLTEIGAIKDGKPVTKFGKKVTFLQFSTEICSQCRQTARLFHELEQTTPDVLHVEVDITHRMELAKKFHIMQTPTTLVLDARGRVTSRIGGAARPQTIADELGSFSI